VLILVRHGRTALNASGRLQGRIDEPLDEVGFAQAKAVAAHVGAIDVLISSPLLRARQTAEAFGVPFETDDRWIELSYGTLEGRSTSDILSAAAWDQWRNDSSFAPEGGESLLALDQRVRAACAEVAEQATGCTIAVVSHVSPIKSAVAWALGAPVDIAWRSQLSQASICRIEVTARGPVLTAFNERAASPDC
jgi:broad specificity phosphatase PhoE